MVFTQLVGNDDVDNLIPKYLMNILTLTISMQKSEACCFICKIERF